MTSVCETRPAFKKETMPVPSSNADLKLDGIQVIELGMMDPTKYYPMTIVSGFAIRGFLYPFTVIKTRMQIQTGKEMYSGTYNALTTIFRNEGLPGLYRGFLISQMLILPQVCYVAVYEQMRTLLSRYADIQNSKLKAGLGGFTASVASQTLIVPIDIISQHLMMMSKAKRPKSARKLDPLYISKRATRLSSTMSVIVAIRTQYGLRGFYKGYFTSLAVYAPNSGLWWMFYDTYCGLVSDVAPVWVPRLVLQCIAAPLGGITTALIMNPMDVIRTRIQVQGHNFGATVRTLWQQEGLYLVTKGLTARLVQSITFSFFIILGYETIKRWSLLDEFKHTVRW